MKVQASGKPVEQIVAAIEAMDLDPIKFKLMDADEGQGWSREQVDRIEIAYRRFLTLLVKYPESTIAPSKEVDKFWHGHILDTMKYADDCQQVFGYFLHHFPYFGMRDSEDATALQEAGQEMQRLYAREFGQSQSKPSYCFAAKGADAAYCFAARSADSAYCFAAKQVNEAAYCFASKPSYCFAAKATDAAYCFAAKQANDAAYCFAAKPSYCFAATQTQGKAVDIHTRPTLALAA